MRIFSVLANIFKEFITPISVSLSFKSGLLFGGEPRSILSSTDGSPLGFGGELILSRSPLSVAGGLAFKLWW